MRKMMLGGAVIAAAVVGSGAGAQMHPVLHAMGAGYPAPGMHPMPMAHPMPAPRPMPARGARWGSKVGGHWWGGVNAPGGWNAYRRPVRGYALPTYWVAPRFFVSDWQGYGLTQPPLGYNWSRYYDDAVLVDSRGSVYDSVSGLDWDGYGSDTYTDAGYADRGYDDRRYDDRRSDTRGLGGAAVGAVAGGVAGNLIAGRGNRLGGTLIGAGVGAAAGYAIDRSASRPDRRPPVAPYAYGNHYDDRGYGDRGYDRAPSPYPVPHPAPGGSWVSPDGSTTVVTTGAGGYYGAGTTTVTVQTQPAVTTTTTTTYEDVVTYRPAKTYRKRWVKPRCACR